MHALAFVIVFYGAARALAMLAIGATRAAWGMGLRPMLDLSRPTYRMARGRASLGRVSLASRGSHVTPAPGGRVVGRSNGPRPPDYAQASPHSCLKDKRAGGAPTLATGNGAGGDSVETPSVLEELTPAAPAPFFTLRRVRSFCALLGLCAPLFGFAYVVAYAFQGLSFLCFALFMAFGVSLVLWALFAQYLDRRYCYDY